MNGYAYFTEECLVTPSGKPKNKHVDGWTVSCSEFAETVVVRQLYDSTISGNVFHLSFIVDWIVPIRSNSLVKQRGDSDTWLADSLQAIQVEIQVL